MSIKNVVITGATSFIGMALVKKMVSENIHVIAVVRSNSNKIESLSEYGESITVIRLDMTEYYKLGECIGKADCFIHLAWNGTRGSDRMNKDLQKLNVRYGLEAIESIVLAGCNKIILAGSQAEYGPVSNKISEKICSNPNTEYGRAKYELYCKANDFCENNGTICCEARIFSIYGPGDNENTLIMKLIDCMKKDELCELTECKQNWDYLYIDDAADAIMSLVNTECESGIYNIASGDIRQLKEYVEEMRSILCSQSEIQYGVIPYPTTGMVNINPDISKIHGMTGWRNKTPFCEGIKKIVKSRNYDEKNQYINPLL